MTDVNPTMKKIEAGGSNSESKAEIHDRLGVYIAIVAIVIAALSYGDQRGTEKANDVKLAQQDRQLGEQRQRIADLERLVNVMSTEVKAAGTDAALAKNTAQRMEARINERRR